MFYEFYGEKLAILSLYVDDIIITWNYKMEIKKLKKHLAKEFEVKGLWIGMILSRD
jgi:hypothetical protein